MADLPEEQLARMEIYLAKIAGKNVELPPAPLSRLETYLAYIAGQNVILPEEPLSRTEAYLDYIARNGISGGGTGGGGTGGGSESLDFPASTDGRTFSGVIHKLNFSEVTDINPSEIEVLEGYNADN